MFWPTLDVGDWHIYCAYIDLHLVSSIIYNKIGDPTGLFSYDSREPRHLYGPTLHPFVETSRENRTAMLSA